MKGRTLIEQAADPRWLLVEAIEATARLLWQLDPDLYAAAAQMEADAGRLRARLVTARARRLYQSGREGREQC